MNPPDLTALTWHWQHFSALSVQALQGIHRARQAVFVMEQACLYADADAHDERAHHLSAWSAEQPMPQAYARLLPPGEKFTEPAIGRVLTLPSARALGLGKKLVQQALTHAARLYPGQKVRIVAQAHLLDFYRAFNFEPVGELFWEGAIAHIEMLLKSPLSPYTPRN